MPVARKKDRYLHDQVLIADIPTKVAAGTFYIEWYEVTENDLKRIDEAAFRLKLEAARLPEAMVKLTGL